MKAFKVFLALILSSIASSSNSEIDSNCPMPDWDLFVAEAKSKPQIVPSVARHKFRGEEFIYLRINGALTGSYYMLWYDKHQRLQISKEFLYLDPTKTYSLPCGYEITASCQGTELEPGKGGRKWDAILLVYTPCFADESPDRASFLNTVGAAGYGRVQSCSRSFSATYKAQDFASLVEHRNRRGCGTVRSRNGLKSVISKIPIAITE